MPDERDLGNRPIVDALVPLLDKLDQQERETAAALAPKRRAAEDALRAQAYALAALLFREVAAAYRAAGLGGHLVTDLERRAVDCDSLAAMKTRRKR